MTPITLTRQRPSINVEGHDVLFAATGLIAQEEADTLAVEVSDAVVGHVHA